MWVTCIRHINSSLLYDDLVLQRKSEEPASEGPPIGTSEDWVVLDSGKSFAWSAKQHGSLQQQIDAMEKLIEQQGQQVYCFKAFSCNCKICVDLTHCCATPDVDFVLHCGSGPV